MASSHSRAIDPIGGTDKAKHRYQPHRSDTITRDTEKFKTLPTKGHRDSSAILEGAGVSGPMGREGTS